MSIIFRAAAFIRGGAGVTISIGGEIGEVGPIHGGELRVHEWF
jgi:hypothetical protein